MYVQDTYNINTIQYKSISTTNVNNNNNSNILKYVFIGIVL